MAALLDLLDSELRLWRDGRAVRSPGYALHDGDRYRFGDVARGHARRQPRKVNTRFWWQLGTRPLQPALGSARHTADLVHGHLLELHREAGEPAELVLAVPDSLQREQLSLLLGIIRACPFDAVGLVNRSLLAASAHDPAGPVWHLELQLHQALLTRLERDGDTLRLARHQVLSGCGLLALQEIIVEAIARAFIEHTRFDPRRQADTEQALYDSLGDTLAELRDADDTTLELAGYRARIDYKTLRGAAERLQDSVSRELARDPGALLLLDPLADLLPGFSGHFPDARVLSPRDLPASLGSHGDSIVQPGEALHLVKSLPAVGSQHRSEAAANKPASATPAPDPPPAGSDAAAPTHLLTNGRARPLRGDRVALASGCALVRRDGAWTLESGGDAAVNGAPWDGGTLAAGDRIRAGDGNWQLIEVAG